MAETQPRWLPAQDAERIRVADVARITSLSVRKVQELAVARKLPGAAKLGGVWTFDPARVRQWIKEQEDVCPASPETSTSEERRGGAESRLPDASIEAAYEQLIHGKRRSGSGVGERSSSARR
jgi:predicted DNA-binding transcriptional regulator AlpA